MVKDAIRRNGDFRQKEHTAAEDLTPGEHLMRDSNGEVQKHSNAPDTSGNGAHHGPLICGTQAELGMSIDDTISSGDEAKTLIPTPGSVAQVFLADGENVDETDPLVSDGSGALKKFSGIDPSSSNSQVTGNYVVGYPENGKDLSGNGSRELIDVRFV